MDKSPGIGKQFYYDGQRLELVGQDEMHVPYFSKVSDKNNKFTLPDGEHIAQQLMCGE
jgi:hypothetical protein